MPIYSEPQVNGVGHFLNDPSASEHLTAVLQSSRAIPWSATAPVTSAQSTAGNDLDHLDAHNEPDSATGLTRPGEHWSPGGETSVYLSSSMSPNSGPAQLTPTSDSSPSQSPGTESETQALDINQALFGLTEQFGPCSHAWELNIPRTDDEAQQLEQPNVPGNRSHRQRLKRRQRVRGAFLNQHDRVETALTRQQKACIRCRDQKLRCARDPNDLTGPCLPCRRLRNSRYSSLPCMRYIITDAVIYRTQTSPNPIWTTRWSTLDIKEMTDWKNDNIIELEMSPVHIYLPYRVQVREYLPRPGDTTSEFYTDKDGVERSIPLPHYAIADMQKTVGIYRDFINRNVAGYIGGTFGGAERCNSTDDFVWKTYLQAFRHARDARTEKERDLLCNIFRLWVASQMTSFVARVCRDGENDKPDLTPVDSPWKGYEPISPMILAQDECIIYSTVLQPISAAVVKSLHSLMNSRQRKEYMLTLYLASFILLTACATTTRRDAEYAASISLNSEFANPKSIGEFHVGATTIIAHFQYILKGWAPLGMILRPENFAKIKLEANMTEDEAQFLKQSAEYFKQREPEFKKLREEKRYTDYMFWLAQLFAPDWSAWTAA